MTKTIGEVLGSRDNALNFVRLVLASSVIFWHTYPLTGSVPSWPASDAGAWAVHGFFAVSGYLIAGSRMRLEFLPYMWRRSMRILPAFWVVLIATAFVFAPLSAVFTGQPYNPLDGLNYVVQNLGLRLRELAVGSTLSHVPHPDSWNGSLWTLFFEFGAYIAAGLLLGSKFVRRNMLPVVAVLFVLFSAAAAVHFGSEFPGVLREVAPAVRLWSFFLAGMLVFTVRDKVGATPYVGAATATAFVTSWLLGIQDWAGQLPFAMLVLWLGAALPIRVGATNDISYGVYIYAFPVQQLLVVAGFSVVAGPLLSAVLALAMTVPVAFASWLWVEKPLQGLSKRWKPSRSSKSGAVLPER